MDSLEFRKALASLNGDVTFRLVPDDEQSDNNSVVRASSIGNCTRQQWYRITRSIRTGSSGENTWANLMGHAGQVVVAAALRAMGYVVDNEEQTGEWEGIRGHIDGTLSGNEFGNELVVWDSKIRNAFGYRMLLKGLPAADPSIWLQLQVYSAALKAKQAIVTVVPFDLSTNRSLMNQYKVDGDPSLQWIVIDANKKDQELAAERAAMITYAASNDLLPSREYDPERGKFPCTYCEWKDLCLLEGDDKSYVVTALPEEWR